MFGTTDGGKNPDALHPKYIAQYVGVRAVKIF
jgi:hypothetical protein